MWRRLQPAMVRFETRREVLSGRAASDPVGQDPAEHASGLPVPQHEFAGGGDDDVLHRRIGQRVALVRRRAIVVDDVIERGVRCLPPEPDTLEPLEEKFKLPFAVRGQVGSVHMPAHPVAKTA